MAPNAYSRIGRVSLSKSNLVDRHQRHRNATLDRPRHGHRYRHPRNVRSWHYCDFARTKAKAALTSGADIVALAG
jgi:hypothetical protein